MLLAASLPFIPAMDKLLLYPISEQKHEWLQGIAFLPMYCGLLSFASSILLSVLRLN